MNNLRETILKKLSGSTGQSPVHLEDLRKPRRPEVARHAAQLKTQHPKWTKNECMAKAKAEYFINQRSKA